MHGRAAIVTGGSRGIGEAIAARLLARGAGVCITARNEDGLAEAAARLGADGRLMTVAGNAADPAHRTAVVEGVASRFGSVDLLVNNTGINPAYGPLVDADLGVIRKILDTNVVSALGWIQEAHARWMGVHGGAVVNVSSVTGLRPSVNLGGYAISKAAVVHLSRQLAAELAPKVRVNAVAPGVVRTRMAGVLYEDREEQAAAAYPMGRIGAPGDVAGAVAFLLSDEAAWITGETLVVDGGLLAAGGVDG